MIKMEFTTFGSKINDRIFVPLSPADIDLICEVMKSKSEESNVFFNQKKYHRMIYFFDFYQQEYKKRRHEFDQEENDKFYKEE